MYDGGLIFNSFLKALAVKGARVFLSAVAKFVVVFCGACQYYFVVTVDNLLDAIYAAIAQFHRVLIDDHVELIIGWEA